MVSTPSSAEALIQQFSKPVKDDPIVMSRITGYAPVRGIVEFAELSLLMGRSERAGNVLKPTLHDFYDAKSSISSVSVSNGDNRAEGAFASVFTTSQPDALKDLLRKSDADSGFLNRWIFASGKPKQRVPIGGATIDLSACIPLLKLIQSWPMLGVTLGHAKQVQWSERAARRMSEFLLDTIYPMQQRDTTGFLSRLDLMYKKLVLLFSINMMDNEVTYETVEKVISMHNYIVAAYAIPQSKIGGSLINEVHAEIERHVRALTKKLGGPTLRELGQRLKRKQYPIDLISKVLKIMVENGEVEPVSTVGTKGGRPSMRYRWIS